MDGVHMRLLGLLPCFRVWDCKGALSMFDWSVFGTDVPIRGVKSIECLYDAVKRVEFGSPD